MDKNVGYIDNIDMISLLNRNVYPFLDDYKKGIISEVMYELVQRYVNYTIELINVSVDNITMPIEMLIWY